MPASPSQLTVQSTATELAIGSAASPLPNLAVDQATLTDAGGVLGVKPLGIGSGSLGIASVSTTKLALGSVTTQRIGAGEVRFTNLGGGSVTNTVGGDAHVIDMSANPNPAETIEFSVTDSNGTESHTLTAGSDFVIGATAADTLANLVAAAISLFSNSQLYGTSDGNTAVVSVLDVGLGSSGTANLVVSNALSNTTVAVGSFRQTNALSAKRLWTVVVEPSAADVTRGFVPVRPTGNDLINGAETPFVLCKDNSDRVKSCDVTVSYNGTLDAWVISNSGASTPFTATDTLLLVAFEDRT